MTYIVSMRGFGSWIRRSVDEMFGLKCKSELNNPVEPQDLPIKGINSDMIVEYIMSRNLGEKKPVLQYSNQVQWGEDTGAVRMKISPIGSFKIFIRKLQPNLEGVQTWVCKKIVAYEEIFNSKQSFDEKIAFEIMNMIEEVAKEEVNSPNPEYEGLEGLTRRIARNSSRTDIIPEIFLYRGVVKSNIPNSWLVVFECKGHGVEAPESRRIEQFNIDMSFNPRTGMMRCIGRSIESPTKGHTWSIQPSEWDEYFSSGQPEKEIIDSICSAFKTF